MVILVIVGWLMCGIPTRGMFRYNLAQRLGPQGIRGRYLLLLWFITLMGPIGLLSAVIACTIDWTWGFKFR